MTRQRAFDVALLDSFASASLQELDYLNEAANQEKFRVELAPKLGGRVYVPGILYEFYHSMKRLTKVELLPTFKFTGKTVNNLEFTDNYR